MKTNGSDRLADIHMRGDTELNQQEYQMDGWSPPNAE